MQKRFTRLILQSKVKSLYCKKFKSSVNYLDRNLLCVGNISSDSLLTNGTKTGLNGNVYDFAIDYVGINNEKTIYDIHRYLMKKYNI